MAASRFAPSAQPKIVDCRRHGPGTGAADDPELILVEGDSALAALANVRDDRHQAVLALQGKPLNAARATAARVDAHGSFVHVAAALGWASPTAPPPHRSALRFARLVLLFDPDADGIHIGALVVAYLLRWQPWWIDEGRLALVHAPMALVHLDGDGCTAPRFVWRPGGAEAVRQAWADELPPDQRPLLRTQVARGLGSFDTPVLRMLIDPARRDAQRLDTPRAQAMAAMLAGA